MYERLRDSSGLRRLWVPTGIHVFSSIGRTGRVCGMSDGVLYFILVIISFSLFNSIVDDAELNRQGSYGSCEIMEVNDG